MYKIESDKFVDNTLIFFKILPFEDIDVTTFLLLVCMLRARSKAWPRRSDFLAMQARLYDLKSNWRYIGFGKSILFYFRISYLANALVQDPDYIRQLLFYIDQALHAPVLTQQALDEAKIIFENGQMALQENPDHIAMMEAIAHVDPNSALSVNLFGSLEKAKEITLDDIKALYEKIEQIPFEVAFGGRIEQEMEDYLSSFSNSQPELSLMEKVPGEKAEYASLMRDIDQISLVQLYRTNILAGEELYYPLMVANALLGHSQNSLLFEEVRERHSLCYGISTSLIRMDGALSLQAQILAGKLDQALEIIEAQFERVRKGEFDEVDLRRAKDDLEQAILFKKDSMSALLDHDIHKRYLNDPLEFDEQIARVQAVDKEQVMASFASVSLISQAVVLPESKEGAYEEN